jgi:hypothetical protein
VRFAAVAVQKHRWEVSTVMSIDIWQIIKELINKEKICKKEIDKVKRDIIKLTKSDDFIAFHESAVVPRLLSDNEIF